MNDARDREGEAMKVKRTPMTKAERARRREQRRAEEQKRAIRRLKELVEQPPSRLDRLLEILGRPPTLEQQLKGIGKSLLGFYEKLHAHEKLLQESKR
jgi:hypothetical protein